MSSKYFFVLCFLVWTAKALADDKIFNVMNFGARSDDNTDNSVAFLKAWSNACKWNGKATILIPQGTYMLKEVLFSGPCNGLTNFRLQGILKAPSDPNSFPSGNWINFKNVDKLIVDGGGTLDGQGNSSWISNDCQKNSKCHPVPTFTLKFDFITNGSVQQINSINSKQTHISLFSCKEMTLTKLKIIAPADSPNTDGIKISMSEGINITSVNIGTGDDCIAMISGTRKVKITDVFCGPGHGISVGSFGKTDDEKDIDDIVVKNCTFSHTSNGVRIKTWASPLKKTLVASNFVYDDIIMDQVNNPIIIDQQYCPNRQCDNKGASNVQIRNVAYKNIRGSGDKETAASFNCSPNKPCQNITVENINLLPYNGGGRLNNVCSHVNGASHGTQNPPSCI